jgi:hypothetical protein
MSMFDPRQPPRPDPSDERAWQDLLQAAPPRVDPGLTLRILTQLPPRPRTRRLRAKVLLLAALLAALVMVATVMPALAQPTGLVGAMVLCLGCAALSFWSVFTVAD